MDRYFETVSPEQNVCVPVPPYRAAKNPPRLSLHTYTFWDVFHYVPPRGVHN